MPVVYGKVMALDAEGRWAARVSYMETPDGLVPVGIDVRPSLWAEDSDDSWPPLPRQLDPAAIPPGGLSLSLLRNIDWSDRNERNQLIVSQILGDLYHYGYEFEAVLEHLQHVTEIAVTRRLLRRGRRDLTRSLFALVESSPDAYPHRTPPTRQQTLDRVRKAFPDFNETELRATLHWARKHEPPLFTSFGHRRAGGLLTGHAQQILLLADPLLALPPDARDEVQVQRAAELPEFRQ